MGTWNMDQLAMLRVDEARQMAAKPRRTSSRRSDASRVSKMAARLAAARERISD